jgi:hypothetical protein
MNLMQRSWLQRIGETLLTEENDIDDDLPGDDKKSAKQLHCKKGLKKTLTVLKITLIPPTRNESS